jgi:S-adenosylmethionine hydrolase
MDVIEAVPKTAPDAKRHVVRYEDLIASFDTEVAGQTARFARTFGQAPPGESFWYRDSFGPVEIAFREDSAAKRLGLGPGDPVLRIA